MNTITPLKDGDAHLDHEEFLQEQRIDIVTATLNHLVRELGVELTEVTSNLSMPHYSTAWAIWSSW